MSDTNNADGVNSADGQNSNNTDGIETKKQHVSYETFDKAMASLNREKQARKELEAQVQKINEEKLLAEGKKDELIDSYRSKLSAFEESAKKEKAERILDRFHSKIAEVATGKGFKNPSLAKKMFSIKDFELDDSGNIDAKALEAKFDEIKTSDSYLFSQSDKKFVDGNPKHKVSSVGGAISKDDLSKMSNADIMSVLLEMDKNK